MARMTKVQQLRLSEDEKIAVKMVARAAGLTMSGWLRSRAIQCAREEMKALQRSMETVDALRAKTSEVA